MIPIANNVHILQFLCENPILSESHNEKYKELFGKSKRFHGLTYKNRFETIYNNIKYHIYSRKGYGTSIEIDASSYEDVNSGKYNDEIINFCNYLIEKLKN